MLTWNNVLFEGKLDGYCEQCNKWTREGGSWQEDYVTYDKGAWLQGVFYCHDCLERQLGSMPEPGCQVDAMQSDDNPFTYAE